MILKRPKILFLYDKNGCCFWRTYKPATAMKEQGLADVTLLQLRTASKDDITKAAYEADIIQAMGLMGTDGLAVVRQYQKLGLKIAIDYDDLHFNCSPFNPAYKQHGLEDVEITDPKSGEVSWLWKDGTNGFDIKKNKIRFMSYQRILQEADLITTTTLYLKDALMEVSQYTAKIRVLPNAIDLTEWKPLDVRDKFSDKFRFGWAVSGSHGEDWVFMRDILLEFLKSHPDAKFVCIGDTYMDVKQGLNEVRDQIEWYPFSDLWEGHYTLRMPLLGLDCAIAPLADNEFNKCKSPLKFEEYTAFGWPTICQDMTPYKEHIVNGHNGLLAGTKEQWLLALNQMYANKDLRLKLRFNALHTVKEMFDLKNIAREWAEVYQNLVTGETQSAELKLNG